MNNFWKLKYIGVYFLATFLMACTPQIAQTQKRNKRQKEVEVIDNRPEWVRAKPNNSAYYIGIGYASSQMSDYQQAAKKSALQDLMSEIKVTVSSKSFLFQSDKNDKIREEYESNIKTTTTGEIQDFELVDTYEDEKQKGYWVYYRLSKAKYQSEKQRKEDNAKKEALDFYKKAQISEQNADWVTALDLYLKGMMSIKDYWGDNTSVEYGGKEIQLGATIYANIQKILDNITLYSATQTLSLKKRMDKAEQFTVSVTDAQQNKLAKMPLKAVFVVGGGDTHPYYTTNTNGEANITVGKVYGKSVSQKLQVTVDMEKVSQGKADDKFYQYLLSRFRLPSHEVIINIEKPVFYLVSDERNMGVSTGQQVLKDKLKSALAAKGVEFTEDKSKAEVWLEMNADTRKGTATESIYIAYLNVNLKAIDSQSQNEIFSTNLNDIKGFQLNYERAGLEAYKKAQEEVEKELTKKVLSAIL